MFHVVKHRSIVSVPGAAMKVSGVVSFEGLTAEGARVLREFEHQNHSGLDFTLGPSPDEAVIRWDSAVRLAIISRIAALVATHETD